MRKIELLGAVATVLCLVISFASVVAGEFGGALVSAFAGLSGIGHFRGIAASGSLFCEAPVGDQPAARRKWKLHRFETVKGSRTSTKGGGEARWIECSLCGVQRQIVRTGTNSDGL